MGEKKISTEILDQIITLAASGQRLSQIAKTIGVHVATICQWRLDNPSFDESYRRAQETGFEVQADQLFDIPHEIEDVNKARLLSDNIKWVLARRARDRYGDKLDVNLNQTVDIKGALADARSRVRDVGPAVITQVIESSKQNQVSATGLETCEDDTEKEGCDELSLEEMLK